MQDLISQVNLTENQTIIFQSIYQKFENIDYWDLEETIQNSIRELKHHHKIGDKEALKYNAKEIRNMHENGNKKIALRLFKHLVLDLQNRDYSDIIYMMKGFYFGKFIYECYQRLTGENLPANIKEIKAYFNL